MSAACAKLGLELVTGVEVSLRDNEFPRVRDGVTKARNVHVLAYFCPWTPSIRSSASWPPSATTATVATTTGDRAPGEGL